LEGAGKESAQQRRARAVIRIVVENEATHAFAIADGDESAKINSLSTRRLTKEA
jgi:hypothetical protein